MKLIILISCVAIGSSFAKIPLPSYFEKCSLSAPNLAECLVEKGSKAIPILIKGDKSIDFPSLKPLKVPVAKFVGKDFTINANDIVSTSFTTFKLLKANFDLKGKKAELTASMEHLGGSGKYKIENGKFLEHTISGSGDFTMKFTGNKITFKADIENYEEGGDGYIKYVNQKYEITHDKLYYKFDNLKTSEGQDVNDYINEHAKEFTAEIESSINGIVSSYISLAIDNIAKNVPLKDIFLP